MSIITIGGDVKLWQKDNKTREPPSESEESTDEENTKPVYNLRVRPKPKRSSSGRPQGATVSTVNYTDLFQCTDCERETHQST